MRTIRDPPHNRLPVLRPAPACDGSRFAFFVRVSLSLLLITKLLRSLSDPLGPPGAVGKSG